MEKMTEFNQQSSGKWESSRKSKALCGLIGQFFWGEKPLILLTHQVSHCQTGDCSPPPALLCQCDLSTEDLLHINKAKEDSRSITSSTYSVWHNDYYLVHSSYYVKLLWYVDSSSTNAFHVFLSSSDL